MKRETPEHLKARFRRAWQLLKQRKAKATK